jgi:hypothetical protein
LPIFFISSYAISVDECADGGGDAHDDGDVRACDGGSVGRLQKQETRRIQVLMQQLLELKWQVRKHQVRILPLG